MKLTKARVLLQDVIRDSVAVVRSIVDRAGRNVGLGILGDNDVRLALNGADALRIADTQQPDIAFLDLKMPEMDGYEVARRIREQPGAGARCSSP